MWQNSQYYERDFSYFLGSLTSTSKCHSYRNVLKKPSKTLKCKLIPSIFPRMKDSYQPILTYDSETLLVDEERLEQTTELTLLRVIGNVQRKDGIRIKTF